MEGLHIIDDFLVFHQRNITQAGICRNWDNFSVSIKDIEIIAYRLGHLLDDEEIAILLVDKKGQIYGFSAFLEYNALTFFKDKFGLDIDEIQKTTKGWDYELRYNEIIYPESLRGKHLFYQPKTWFAKVFWWLFYHFFNTGVNSTIGKFNQK